MKQKPKEEYDRITKTFLSPEKVERYHQLLAQLKKAEKELEELKQGFHLYFDHHVGQGTRGVENVGDFTVQRQIRESRRYDDQKTVRVLEELQLSDCIIVTKKPDSEKVDAALALGLIAEHQLVDCLIQKRIPAILVKKVN